MDLKELENEKWWMKIIFSIVSFFTLLLIVSIVLVKLKNNKEDREQEDREQEDREQEDARGKVVEIFCEKIGAREEEKDTVLSSLCRYSLRTRTDYLDEENSSIEEIRNHMEKNLKKNKKETYSSFPKNADEIQKGIDYKMFTGNFILACSFFPRYGKNGAFTDWKKVLEKKINRDLIYDDNKRKKIQRDIGEIERIIQEKINTKIMNKAQNFSDADNLSAINEWMEEYLNETMIGLFLLNFREKLSFKIEKTVTHSLVEYRQVNNQKIGVILPIHIFSF